MSAATFSTFVQVDLNYPSYGTAGTRIGVKSLDTTQFNCLTISQKILSDVQSGLSPGVLTTTGTPTADFIEFLIPNMVSGSNYDNSLCVILLKDGIKPTEAAGLFLYGTVSPLTISPSSGDVGSSSTITRANTIGSIDINFTQLVTSFPSPPPNLAETQLNSSVIATGPYNGTLLVPPTGTTPTTFTFSVPLATVVGVNQVLATYAYNEPGVLVGPFPMNIGTFTVTSGPSPPVICFKEDSKILCIKDNKEQELSIQDVKKGTLVKTLHNGFVPVKIVGKSTAYNSGNNERIKDRLYKLSKSKYPELNDDLYLTGCHSILVDFVTAAQRTKIEDILGDVYVTDGKYRLLTCVDERAEPHKKEGTYNIYHLALESEESNRNYGIYANGLLVESCFERRIQTQMLKID